jgi:inorganic pyrophosphatase
MVDAGVSDSKIIAVAVSDPQFNSYQQASQLPVHYSRLIRRLVQDYEQLENKTVKAGKIRRAKQARHTIAAALKRYANTYARSEQS